jgi:hypothetical protein
LRITTVSDSRGGTYVRILSPDGREDLQVLPHGSEVPESCGAFLGQELHHAGRVVRVEGLDEAGDPLAHLAGREHGLVVKADLAGLLG